MVHPFHPGTRSSLQEASRGPKEAPRLLTVGLSEAFKRLQEATKRRPKGLQVLNNLAPTQLLPKKSTLHKQTQINQMLCWRRFRARLVADRVRDGSMVLRQ